MFEMCIDEETYNSLAGGQEVAWAKPYKCEGIDTSIFPKGELPMKKILIDEGMDNAHVAAMYYAMAHRAGHAKGPPVAMLRIEMGYQGLTRGFLNGTLVPHVEQHGVGFKENVTRENYPELTDVVFHPIQNGQEVLDHGYNLLKKKSKITGLNA